MTGPATGLHRLGTALRRAAVVSRLRLAGRLPPGRHPDVGDSPLFGESPLFGDPGFRQSLGRLLQDAPPGLLAGGDFFFLPGDRPPWLDTGIDVAAGETVTWLAAGRVVLSRLFDIFVEPHFQLWARIGDGAVFSGTRASHTFTADRAGRIHLASYFPGQWATRSGELATSPDVYRGVRGGISVLLLRWAVDPRAGLRRLAAGSDPHPLLALEIDRLENPVQQPEGWKHLWFLGDSEIYSPGRGDDGAPEVRCATHCDVGILQRAVDAPLRPDTRLAWRWRVDSLPSELAEDTLPTHDYLSIAVEFENGIDLTYYWSASLPVGTGYWCPLPTWREREFHVVVRSGREGLGRWIAEERDVYADYERYVGSPPDRIERIWLIANSTFQRGVGRCAYRDIEIRCDTGPRRLVSAGERWKDPWN
jgi:hypothetical protein